MTEKTLSEWWAKEHRKETAILQKYLQSVADVVYDKWIKQEITAGRLSLENIKKKDKPKIPPLPMDKKNDEDFKLWNNKLISELSLIFEIPAELLK